MIKYKTHTITHPESFTLTEEVRKAYEDILKRIDGESHPVIVLPVGWKYSRE